MMTGVDRDMLQGCNIAAGGILSLYLDTDQSKAENLNRAFETAFNAKIKELQPLIKPAEEFEFQAVAMEMRKLLSAHKPQGRGLVMFAPYGGPIWFRELNVPVATEVHWGRQPYIKQFVEALDEFETYAAIVVDRCHSRIFTMNLGILQKHGELHALEGVRHSKTAGADHLYSQSRLQRRADEHMLLHLKRVAKLIQHVEQHYPFDRLVLAGSNEATSELFRLLPKSMRYRVVSSVVVSANAPENRILDELLLVARQAERTHELKKVEELMTAAAKKHKAVVAVPATLQALNERRVRAFLYVNGMTHPGCACEACHAVFRKDASCCVYCGRAVKPLDDLLEEAIETALRGGALIEQVRGAAAEKLSKAGGIGAFLRF